MTHLSKRSYVTATFFIVAIAFLFLAAIGGVRSYSPVPITDMWYGYLGFFNDVSDGDLGAWWVQHNEHRIVLSRALFWLDLYFFKGAAVFLVVFNYVLVSLSFWLFWKILGERIPEEEERFARNLIGLVILVLLFSWAQNFNLSSGFQSQFFLAQQLPLLSFYLLHRAHVAKAHSKLLFILACLTAFAALGSMANGVLTFPLMVGLGLIVRIGWRRIAVLLVFAAISNLAYFYDYVQPPRPVSLVSSLLHNPAELLRFVLLYLGSPFYYVEGLESKALTQIAGLFLIASAAYFAYGAMRNRSKSSLQLALLTFLLYIGGTALGTAGGRLNFGDEFALSSRYTTPALMAWAALLVLYAPAIARGMAVKPQRFLVPLFMIAILLLPTQLSALKPQNLELFERQYAALALALGIEDDAQIQVVYPLPAYALKWAREASERHLSIFSGTVFEDARNSMGRLDSSKASVACIGYLDEIAAIESASHYSRIRGWIFHNESSRIPERLRILDRNGVVVGYALTGHPRPDVEAVHPNAGLAGFKGYLLTDKRGDQIVLKGSHPDCELTVAAASTPVGRGGPAMMTESLGLAAH